MRTRLLTITASLILLGACCAHAGLSDLLKSKTKTTSGNADMGLPSYKGLKHSIGVMDFENAAGWSGRWKLGSNLGIMLESALYDSGRFIVVERDNLGGVLTEQDLMASGRMAQGNKVAQTGKLRGARYLAAGAVTEVEENNAGSEGGISFKGISLGGGGGQAHIAAIIKIIDSTTGEIVAKERVVGKAGSKKLRIGYRGSDFGGNLGSFNKTPLGEAAQDVIVQAVKFLAGEFEELGFQGSVIKTSTSGQVLINRGTNHGVEVGQKFVIATKGEQLIDPDTGEVLDEEEGEVIARIEATKVKEKISYCKLLEGVNPEKGAVVTAE